MSISHSLLLAALFCAAPVQAQVFPTPAPLAKPNTTVEAQAARALQELAPAILNERSANTDSTKITLARAFADLGRTEAGVRAANAMIQVFGDPRFGKDAVRDDVYRVGVRRKAVVGDITGGRALIPLIKDNHVRADALFAVARAQTRAGDVKSAQKTLFQALPLVGDSLPAQTYAAVLLSRATEPSAAKRLLERIAKALPPQNNNDGTGGIATSNNWDLFTWATIQTGQFDIGERLNLFVNNRRTSQIVGALLRQRRFDIAEKVARQTTDKQEQLFLLPTIARSLWPTNPERAAALAQEVSDRLHQMPAEPELVQHEEKIPAARDIQLLGLAALYQEVGEKEKATALVNEILGRSSPSAAVFVRRQFSLGPLLNALYSPAPDANTPRFSKAQVDHLNTEIKAMPKVSKLEAAIIYSVLAEAQIKAGQKEEARATLEQCENLVLTIKPPVSGLEASDTYQLQIVLNIAKQWKALGDTKRASDFLKRLWNSPLASGISPRERAWKLIEQGWVNEGKGHLLALGLKHEEETHNYRSLALYEGIANPAQIPQWLQKVRDPKKKAALLSEFARGLTQNWLYNHAEQEFSLTAGGYGMSNSY